jgi:hypothetical protein
MAPGKKIIVNMRADKATNDIVVMEAFEDGIWTQIATARVGTEIYASELPGPGQFALVKLPVGASPTVSAASDNGFNTPASTSPQGTTTSTNGSVLYIAAGGMVLLLLLGLVIARKRMSAG